MHLDRIHGTLILDPSGVIVYCSATLCDVVGRAADAVVGMPVGRLLPGYGPGAPAAEEPSPVPTPGADDRAGLRLACADGRSVPMEVAATTLQGNFGALCVLELRAADGRLDGEPELQKLAWSVEQSSDAVVISDADGVIHYVNPAFEAMTGFARAEVLGRTPRFVKSGHHSADFYRSMWDALRSGVEFRGVLINRKKSGELFHEEKVIRPFFGSDGRITHFVSIGRDVTDRIREMESLTRAATHDSLTDLPNRRLFFDRLGQALRQAARRGTGLAVAVVDVDRFKAINDLHGHLAGDAVLQGVAFRLQQCVREEDTVARLGGDEFGLILLDTPEPAVAGTLFEKILRSIGVPLPVDDYAIAFSVSIGASLSRAGEGDGRELMQRADEAMYRAKRAGGNCYRLGSTPGAGDVSDPGAR